MVTDSSAVRIQRAVRAYMASRFGVGRVARQTQDAAQDAASDELSFQKRKSDAKGPEGGVSHVTPPAGGQGFFGGGTPGGPGGAAGAGLGLPPTPYRAGRSPAAGSPVRRTPPGNCGLPPMTPGNGGVCGAEREQVLSAWKKGIENQVSIIHEQLIDSARKGSVRSRSRSPPPSSVEMVSSQCCSNALSSSDPPVRAASSRHVRGWQPDARRWKHGSTRVASSSLHTDLILCTILRQQQLQFDQANPGASSPLRSNSPSPVASPSIVFKDANAREHPNPLAPPLPLADEELSTAGGACQSHKIGAAGAVGLVGEAADTGKDSSGGACELAHGGLQTPGKARGRDRSSPSRAGDKSEARTGTGCRAAARSPYEASPQKAGLRYEASPGRLGSRPGSRALSSPARAGTSKATGASAKAKCSAGSTEGSATSTVGRQSPFRRAGGLQHGTTPSANLKMMPLPALPSPV